MGRGTPLNREQLNHIDLQRGGLRRPTFPETAGSLPGRTLATRMARLPVLSCRGSDGSGRRSGGVIAPAIATGPCSRRRLVPVESPTTATGRGMRKATQGGRLREAVPVGGVGFVHTEAISTDWHQQIPAARQSRFTNPSHTVKPEATVPESARRIARSFSRRTPRGRGFVAY
jgi:hypothetical protein